MPREAVAALRARVAGSAALRPDFLALKRVKPQTLRYYQRSHSEVVSYAKRRRLAYQDQKSRDSLLVMFLHHLYWAGEALFAARSALFGFSSA